MSQAQAMQQAWQHMRQRLEGRGALDSNSQDAQASDQGRWPAELNLRFSVNQTGGSKLSRCQHRGPLYVQKPFYPEGDELAHVYLLHPPGGIVTGDHLKVDIVAEQGAQALLTTPGAARLYRARCTESDGPNASQKQSVHLQAEAKASLEWFPLETIVYNKAEVDLSTRVHLHASASYMAWEITCFGLPASQAPFEHGCFRQDYQVWREDRPIFVDRLKLDDNNRQRFLTSKAAMNLNPVYGFFIACGLTKDEAVLENIRAVIEQEALSDLVSVTQIGEALITRYLGDSAEQARKIFVKVWHTLRPLLLSREASEPRIWLT